jgi:Cdc6-like AAA superfamily ATPase
MKVKEGDFKGLAISSAIVKKVSKDDYFANYKGSAIIKNNIAYSCIGDDLFVIAGLRYGDDESHYLKINDTHFNVVLNFIFNVPFNMYPSNEQYTTLMDAPKKSYIKTYIMIDEINGFYKIGKSNNPLYRESTLQSEKPSVKLLHVFDKDIEYVLHQMFSIKRIRGEWFSLTQEDLDIILKKYN